MPNVAETLRNAAATLSSSGINEPRREAASLLAFALGRDRTFLVTRPEYELSAEEKTRFDAILGRRRRREPLQHITGRQEFFGLEFEVSGDVLIPRPETEAIVENAVELLRPKKAPRFVEVGVGSGCISVSILHEVGAARAVGLDISEKAVLTAARNADRHAVADRIEFRLSDVFAALSDEENEAFDLVVSNPPYIAPGELAGLEPEVRDFEPLEALTDGRDGFSIIEKIVAEAPRRLRPAGVLLMEIGFGQADDVEKMLAPAVWRSVEIIPDLQGIPRTVRAERKS